MKINKTVKQLSKLSQYKNASEKDLKNIAEKVVNLKQKIKDLDISNLFIDKEEKKKAKELAKKYLQDFIIETVSDKNTLKSLIYLEILNIRLQNIINNLHVKNKAVPLKLIESIHHNIDKINQLKEQLGLNKKDKKEESNVFKYLELLKKKFKIWRENNQASRTLKCPYCGQLILLKIRTDCWEAQKHCYFKDGVLYNKTLFENLNKTVLIDKEFIAKVLECSPYYVDWMIKKAKSSNK